MALDAEDYAFLKQQIIQCLQDQEQSLQVLKESIRNKDVTIFLGHTRSGKSTLVNYFLNNTLEAWEERRRVFKIRMDREYDGPEIGQGSLSCTAIPGVYRIPGNPDKVIIDSPGFEDNRGVIQDIMNALCISQIKTARTVKFVLVFDINDITNDNIGHFIHSLQHTQTLICNFDELKNSFCVILTKDSRDYNQDEIAGLFMNKILNVERLDMDKVLVRNFFQNRRLIGIFKMPRQIGEVTSDIDLNVKGAIRECHQVDVDKCEILFALSDKAQEVLLQIYPEYTDTYFFEEQVNKITERYTDYFDVDRYVFASYNNELEHTKNSLETIASSLLEHGNEQRVHLFEIQVSLDRLLEHPTSGEFKANFKFMIMLDCSKLLEERYKNMIMQNYVNSLMKLYEKVDALLGKINVEIEERKKNNIIFTLAGSAGAVGIVPALSGAAKMLDGAIKTSGNVFSKIAQPGVAAYGMGEAAIGGAATAGLCIAGAAFVGAGAGTAYVLYKETYGRRYEARLAQGRTV
ncbi:hypothetical protein ILUMI_20767 [Ignelater luminosus]|uniref:G domain-containing protein n=1 Tax=Ignelater luminosus TaxID=2038154 RepID=A0A8K0CHN4_IGNLU|nr:hypothetical protein ILUMI_20767 [Ignelater luminosus]